MTDAERILHYEISEIKGRNRVFLKEKILPLLSDAIDGIELSKPEFAVRRIKSAIEAINEAVT